MFFDCQFLTFFFSAFFGTGQLSMIKEAIDGLERPPAQTSNGDNKQPDSTQTKRPVFVSAIFVSTYRLSSKQRGIMEEVLEKPVLDRYNIVLQIFKRHARTKEARLQVSTISTKFNKKGSVLEIKKNTRFQIPHFNICSQAIIQFSYLHSAQVELAELPYLRSRLVGDYEVELLSKHDRTKRKGEQYFDSQRDLLNRFAVLTFCKGCVNNFRLTVNDHRQVRLALVDSESCLT
jgi:hypothetical protein